MIKELMLYKSNKAIRAGHRFGKDIPTVPVRTQSCRSFIILLTLIFQCLVVTAQPVTISGMVIDAYGEPLTAANIYLEGRLEGAVSASDGSFQFSVKRLKSDTLICAYVGYVPYRQAIRAGAGDTLRLSISLRRDAIGLSAELVTASVFSTGEGEGVTLTPLEVLQTPGAAADVFWAIKTFPGVQQVEEGAGLFVRGGDVSETIVLLDGAYLNHPYRYESPNGGFFGTITPFLLKETFFSSGGFGAEYGNALSGALIMESQGLPVERSVTLGYGLAAASAAFATPIISEKMGISFSGNYSDTEALFRLNGNQRHFSRFPRAYDLNLNWNYQYSSTGSLKLFLFRESDRLGIEITDPDNSAIFSGSTANNLMNLRWRDVRGKRLLLQANVAFTSFEQQEGLGVLDLTTDDRLGQLRFIAEYDASTTTNIKVGVESFRNDVQIDGTVPQNYLDLTPSAPTWPVHTNYTSIRNSAFAEMVFSPHQRIKFVSGVRMENESVSEASFIDPRTSLTLELIRGWNLVASSGQYHQFARPDLYDPFIGNPDLGPFSAHHNVIGLVRQSDDSQVRIEFYDKSYDNLLLESSIQNYTNTGYGSASGIDVFLKRKWERVNGWISYSYLDASRFWEDSPKESSPIFDITHNLTTVLEFALAPQWQAGAGFRYATGKPYTSAAHLYHDSRVPAYAKLDVNMSYLRRFFAGNLSVFYLSASNILGRDNIFDYIYSADFERREAVKSSMLRTIYFGVSVSF